MQTSNSLFEQFYWRKTRKKKSLLLLSYSGILSLNILVHIILLHIITVVIWNYCDLMCNFR